MRLSQVSSTGRSQALAPVSCVPASISIRRFSRLPLSRRITVSHALTEVETVAMGRLATERPAITGQQDALVQLLRQAGASRDVEPELVEGAMLELEALAAGKSDGKPLGEGGNKVDGRWRVVFSTATKLRFFQYIPVLEDLNIEVGAKRIALESWLGPFRFDIKGSIKSWDEATAKMGFDFNHLDVVLMGNKIWGKERAPSPKSYSYYYVSSDLCCVRSSNGGVTLLVKSP